MTSQTKHIIDVVPYNSDWPKAFEEEAQVIHQALGGNSIAIHHIGSTAVPGLAAKPTIDILAVVKEGEKSIYPLQEAGYHHRGEWNIPFKYGFAKRQDRSVNLHVYEEGHPEIDLNLQFRDYLRAHPEACKAYDQLKYTLLEDKASFEKNGSLFAGYTLGKDPFIRDIIKQTGFNQVRFLRCTHYGEWEAAKILRQKYFFDKALLPDPYTWTFTHPDHAHFILCQGIDMAGYAHVQLWPQSRSALRIIVIDEPYRRQGLGRQLLFLIEQWLKKQGYRSLHIESSPEALLFYEKRHYSLMPFNDPDGYESDPRDTPLGKAL